MVRSAFDNEVTRESDREIFEGLVTVVLAVVLLCDIEQRARGTRGALTRSREKFVVYNA